MIKPIAKFLPARFGLMRFFTLVLTVAIAVVFLAIPLDSADAKRKKYKKYAKNNKAYHRTYKRAKYRAGKKAGRKIRKRSKRHISKRARHRKYKRAKTQVIRINPNLAKARSALKIGPKYFSALQKFYRERAYKKAWYSGVKLNENGTFLLERLKLAGLDGLNQADFVLPSKELAKPGLLADIKISLSLVRYAEQVQAGRLSPSEILAEHDLKPQHPDLVALLKNLTKSKAPAELFDLLPPPHLQYKQLKAKLADLRQHKQLHSQDTMNLGNSLRQAVTKTTRAQENMIIANMERWRWIPRQLGEKHIWINLPSYQLLVKETGKITFSTKGIIGKISAPTPLISSKIKNIILNPFWNIPASFVASDILPKLQANQTNYLQDQEIKITRRSGRIVDPDSVDWKKITNPRTYRFRQSPGRQNALGKMKVLFPNSHAIFLHDTNEPELFSKTSRALSLGCIRLANPIGFADAIASYDKHLQSQMPGTLLGPREHWLKYKATLPVHLVYFTAEIDATGKLTTLPDIYGYDGKITSIFNANSPSS